MLHGYRTRKFFEVSSFIWICSCVYFIDTKMLVWLCHHCCDVFTQNLVKIGMSLVSIEEKLATAGKDVTFLGSLLFTRRVSGTRYATMTSCLLGFRLSFWAYVSFAKTPFNRMSIGDSILSNLRPFDAEISTY